MSPADLPALRDRMAECVEAISGKAPSEGAVKGWFVALRDLRIDQVVDALDGWLRTKSKVPTPADIRAIVGSRLGEKIERDASAPSMTLADMRPCSPDSPAYREFKRRLAEILARPKPGPRDWARKLRAKERSGEKLLLCQMRAWREALRDIPRSPTEIEADEERAAIVAESEIAEHA